MSYSQAKHGFSQTSQVKYWMFANGNVQNILLSMSNHIHPTGWLLCLILAHPTDSSSCVFSKMPVSARGLCLCSLRGLELSMNAQARAHPYY